MVAGLETAVDPELIRRPRPTPVSKAKRFADRQAQSLIVSPFANRFELAQAAISLAHRQPKDP
jgi:hypothetical protein